MFYIVAIINMFHTFLMFHMYRPCISRLIMSSKRREWQMLSNPAVSLLRALPFHYGTNITPYNLDIIFHYFIICKTLDYWKEINW